LVAAFGFETAKLDSVNAFLNRVLDEAVYCEFHEGLEEIITELSKLRSLNPVAMCDNDITKSE
jgi:hypothetical protein